MSEDQEVLNINGSKAPEIKGLRGLKAKGSKEQTH